LDIAAATRHNFLNYFTMLWSISYARCPFCGTHAAELKKLGNGDNQPSASIRCNANSMLMRIKRERKLPLRAS